MRAVPSTALMLFFRENPANFNTISSHLYDRFSIAIHYTPSAIQIARRGKSMHFRIQIPTVLRTISTKISNLITKIENHPWLARVPKRLIRPGLAILALLVLGSAIYFPIISSNSKTTTAATKPLQTSTARQGDLVLYASGSGTLISAEEVDLAFRTSGQVKAVYIKVGDQVKKGDLLAEVDDTSAQIQYEKAKRTLTQLTTVGAVASAQEAVAAAQTELVSAIRHLEYLIGPDVYKWELEVQKAEQALEQAKTAAEAAPSDEQAQQKLKDAEAYLVYAQDKLKGNQYYYKHEYLPINFTRWDKDFGTYIAAPNATEIMQARATVSAAKATLQEAQYLYTALTGGQLPDNATGAGLTELEQAQLDLESAQATLDGTKITAPFSGTIMAVDTSVGDSVDTSTVITLANLNRLYIEIYLDKSEWNNIAVGYPAEITFDALPDKTFTGQVTQVDPGLYTSDTTSVVRATVMLDTSNGGLDLPTGTSAAVDVIAGKAENAVLVPVEALHKAGDQYAVFVMADGKLRLRLVEVGIQDSAHAEIKSGLKAGEVVTTGIIETK
jgi:HlyD family secretion protein